MSRPIYVPIADTFFESSIMREDVTVRFVMLALIRLGLRPGANGEIDVDPFIFAQSINIPFPDVESAIHRLMQPDPSSGCLDEDGRRIVPINPDRPMRGWRLVNWARYKAIVHRANDAARKREERHEAEDTTDSSENVQKRPDASINGATIRDDMKREEKRRGRERSAPRSVFVPPTMEEIRRFVEDEHLRMDPEDFYLHFEANGWLVGGKTPMKSWRASVKQWAKREPEFKPEKSREWTGNNPEDEERKIAAMYYGDDGKKKP